MVGSSHQAKELHDVGLASNQPGPIFSHRGHREKTPSRPAPLKFVFLKFTATRAQKPNTGGWLGEYLGAICG